MASKNLPGFRISLFKTPYVAGLLILTVLLIAAAPSAIAQSTGIPPSEYAALYMLYISTDGNNWTDNTNWLSGFPASSWYGITVADGHVIGVVLPSNNLTGSIPPELGNLKNLISLMLDSNKLTGGIPEELGDIDSLVLLWLDGNNLSGDIPLFLANPPEYVDLRSNHLTVSGQDLLDAIENAHSFLFRSTQTIPPENLAVRVAGIDGREENRILLSWDPISYAGDEGGYQVFYRKAAEPDYYYYGMTADKAAASIAISDLEPGVEYDFKVKTVTWAHDYQKLIPS